MVNPSRGMAGSTGFAPIDYGFVRERRSWFIGLGAVFLVLGALAVLVPAAASLVTTMMLGWLLIFAGIAQGVHAWENRKWGGSNWAFLSAFIHIVAGIMVLSFPLAGTLALTLILAAYLVADGVLKIVRALQHRAMENWGWLLFDGILAVVLGFLIALKWPSTAVWALGLLVGVNLMFGGASMLLIGLGASSRARAGV